MEARVRQFQPLPARWSTATGEKGSVYSKNSDGTVTRTKTADLQAEQSKRGVDQDQATTMDNTRFVHPDHHEGLTYAQMNKKLVVGGVIHKATPLGTGKGLGFAPVPENHVSLHPKEGYLPVEWNNNGEAHLGHPIVGVTYA